VVRAVARASAAIKRRMTMAKRRISRRQRRMTMAEHGSSRHQRRMTAAMARTGFERRRRSITGVAGFTNANP
jgi:hypothetical protein